MFGISGFELLLVILVILMLFGSDKIPDIARTLGKTIRQIKYATEDIKNEIQKSAAENGLDKESLTGGISKEIEQVKQDLAETLKTSEISPMKDIEKEVNKTKEDIESFTGPIKRQF